MNGVTSLAWFKTGKQASASAAMDALISSRYECAIDLPTQTRVRRIIR